MIKLINIKTASELCGLSVVTLRRRVASGTLPYTRSNTNTKHGKILFDAELLMTYLKNEIYSNCAMGTTPEPKAEASSYLASLFKPSSDIADAQAEQDSNFGYEPMNTVKSASFTK